MKVNIYYGGRGLLDDPTLYVLNKMEEVLRELRVTVERINIFEHNTPLHDGAIIVRGDRIVSATCYLPLSDNMLLSKELGTRHRAGVGISEATDSMTVIVSEETGKISVAYGGQLHRGLTADELRDYLSEIQDKVVEEKRHIIWKGRAKNGQ